MKETRYCIDSGVQTPKLPAMGRPANAPDFGLPRLALAYWMSETSASNVDAP